MHRFAPSSCSKPLGHRAPPVLLAAALCTAPIGVRGEWDDAVQVHGFLTQGFVSTSANNWFGDSENGSVEFRELGINASAQTSPRLQFSAQLLSRTAGGMDDGELRLDYGLVDWTAVSRSDRRLGIRIGRIKNPLGFFNETRDVAFTRPGIFLPQEVYFDRVRNLMLSSDGVQVYWDMQLGRHDLSLQAGAGYPVLDRNVEYTLMLRDWQGSLSADRPITLGQLAYEADGGRWRAALSGVNMTLDFTPGPQDPPPPLMEQGDIEMSLWIASLQYNAEHWSLTAEYLQQRVTWKGVGVLFEGSLPGEGYFAQGNYRLQPDIDLFLRYGARFPNTDDRSGAGVVASGRPAHINWAKDWVLGVRWNPLDDLMLRLEYHWVDGTAWLSNRENAVSDLQGRWNMLAALVSYRF